MWFRTKVKQCERHYRQDAKRLIVAWNAANKAPNWIPRGRRAQHDNEPLKIKTLRNDAPNNCWSKHQVSGHADRAQTTGYADRRVHGSDYADQSLTNMSDCTPTKR